VTPGSLAKLWATRPVKEITRHEIEDIVEDAKAKGIPGLRVRRCSRWFLVRLGGIFHIDASSLSSLWRISLTSIRRCAVATNSLAAAS
jgi:hypothetical protein